MTGQSSNISGARGAIQFTHGSLWKNMLLFSVPLMLSQLLQVLFNMADVAVVGKFSSAEALGAVGSTTILVSLFTGFLIGMGSAVNVQAAQHLGARIRFHPHLVCHLPCSRVHHHGPLPAVCAVHAGTARHKRRFD